MTAMREKVARAIGDADHGQQGRAALEACCYEELVEALQNCRSLVELHYGGTDHTGHAAIAQANAVLAKVKDEGHG